MRSWRRRSQKAALKAWGTTTDLFAAGRAAIVEDEAIQAEALAHPGEVIKRSRGDGIRGLVFQGARDALADVRLLHPVVDGLGSRARLVLADQADHALHAPARTGRTSAEALSGLLDACAEWLIEHSLTG